jgi:hypothetical protein
MLMHKLHKRDMFQRSKSNEKSEFEEGLIYIVFVLKSGLLHFKDIALLLLKLFLRRKQKSQNISHNEIFQGKKIMCQGEYLNALNFEANSIQLVFLNEESCTVNEEVPFNTVPNFEHYVSQHEEWGRVDG